jgi:hypothetical protein
MATGAAVAATMTGITDAPAAHADNGSTATDLGLLDTAQANVTEAFSVLDSVSGMHPVVPADFGDAINRFEAIQEPLLSSDNSFLSGLGHFLFDGPDQQLAQASDTFLTAAQSFAVDPTSITNELDALSASFQFDGALLFGSLFPNVVGKVIDQVFDIGGFDTAAAGADQASGFDLPF